MVTVPAFVWRGGFLSRVLKIGVPVGLALGALAWLDSGSVAIGVLVLVLVGTIYGVWMARRMDRYWPGAKQLTGADRVAVADAVRRGQPVGDERLAQAARNYRDGLHAAAERARPWRWFIGFLLVVAVGTALWDAVFGSWGSAVASAIYLVALGVELFWWPRRQDQILANADHAATMDSKEA
jgi:hypothetical protein